MSNQSSIWMQRLIVMVNSSQDRGSGLCFFVCRRQNIVSLGPMQFFPLIGSKRNTKEGKLNWHYTSYPINGVIILAPKRQTMLYAQVIWSPVFLIFSFYYLILWIKSYTCVCGYRPNCNAFLLVSHLNIRKLPGTQNNITCILLTNF